MKYDNFPSCCNIDLLQKYRAEFVGGRRKRGIDASRKINTTKTYSERFPILDPSVRFPIFNSLCPISDFGY